MIGDVFGRVKAQQQESERVENQTNSVEEPWAIIPEVFASVPRTKEWYVTPDMWLGPSTVSGICPRAFVMAGKSGAPLIKHEDLKKKWIMDRGTHVIHEMLQGQWFGNSGLLLGGWKCDDCGHVHGISDDKTPIGDGHSSDETIDKVNVQSAVPKPEVCEACGMQRRWRHDFTYVEPMVYDLDLRVSGYMDGIIRVMRYGVIEGVDFKGTSKKALARLKKRDAYFEHMVQMSWYLAMAKLSKGRIIYIARDEEDPSKAFLEKPITLDEKLIAKERSKVRALREEIKKDQPVVPPCPHGGVRPWGPCECRGF